MSHSPGNSHLTTFSKCEEHRLLYSEVCLHERCNKRFLCRACKMVHSDSHSPNFFSLSALKSGDLGNSIANIIARKERDLSERINEKDPLISRVNAMFMGLETEVVQILTDAKTEIIQTIEKLHHELKIHYNEAYFEEIKSYLKRLSQELKHKELEQQSSDLENFSMIYSKTISSINYGIQIASKFEEDQMNFQDILDVIRTSCNTLVSRTAIDSSKEEIKNFFGQEKVKIAPQTAICIDHCPNMNLFVTGGIDGLLTFWNAASFAYESHIQAHEDSIVAMVYLESIKTLVTSSKDSILGILSFKEDGSAPVPYKAETKKVITQLVAVSGGNRLATISDRGNRVRIWELNNSRLVHVDQMEIDVTLSNSKMFYIPGEELLGMTFADQIKLYSCKNKGQVFTLQMRAAIISACFVEETKTIHVIVFEGGERKYKEMVWRKEGQEYICLQREEMVDKTALYGEPIEVLANGQMVYTIYSQGFVIKKAKRLGDRVRFVEMLTQGCDLKNKKPVLLARNESKIVIGSDNRKLKIYTFS